MCFSIKPLEWAESNEGYAKGQWFANSIFGEYCTYIHIPSGRAWLQGPQLREFFDTIAVAKAAAQADYEQRIRSALSPAQSLAVSDITPPETWMLEPAAIYLEMVDDDETGSNVVVANYLRALSAAIGASHE